MIDFSAQFGGQDAARAVLPHFRALKMAARGVGLSGFPFPKLAFILRVDGEVTVYGVRGAEHIDTEPGGYLSVDVGVSREDWKDLGPEVASKAITDALFSSVDLLERWNDKQLVASIDIDSLRDAVRELCGRYDAGLAQSPLS